MRSAARTAAAVAAAVAVVAALLVPGLGHAVLGKKKLGAAFFAIVSVTWGVGLLLDGRLPEVQASAPITVVGAAAGWGAGLLTLSARLLGLAHGDPAGPTLEYGTTFLMCAAVMNLLLVLDTWERARGRK